MMNKKASVAKWVALAVVPLSLTAVLANVAHQRREERAKIATQELLVGLSRRETAIHTPVEELIAEGADVNGQDAHGRGPLDRAVCGAPDAVVETLLKHGANPNFHRPSKFGGDTATPLIMALEYGSVGTVELLLKYGADPNLRIRWSNKTTSAVLQMRFHDKRSQRYREIMQLLKAAGAKE